MYRLYQSDVYVFQNTIPLFTFYKHLHSKNGFSIKIDSFLQYWNTNRACIHMRESPCIYFILLKQTLQ